MWLSVLAGSNVTPSFCRSAGQNVLKNRVLPLPPIGSTSVNTYSILFVISQPMATAPRNHLRNSIAAVFGSSSGFSVIWLNSNPTWSRPSHSVLLIHSTTGLYRLAFAMAAMQSLTRP